MIEVELKFQVPAAAQRAVQAAIERGAAQRVRLQAIYFDTADRRLAAAGIALRLRKEGKGWVQTVKAGGLDAMQRLEHNVALPAEPAPSSGSAPIVDPLRHAGTPVGDRLAAALAAGADETAAPPLVAHYRTDVVRRHRALRAAGGWVELAFDSGAVIAGDKRLPIAELEVELLRGKAEAVIAVARRWVERHGVWLDVRSKAERGDRLARGIASGPVVKASPVVLDRGISADAARYVVIANCLRQILPNASEIASEDCGEGAAAGAGADHVHQLRVGLRRLRSALRFFHGWTAPLDPDWSESLTQLFRELGAARDRDALSAALLPSLRKAGAPLSELPPAQPAPTPAEVLRARPATLALLAVLAFQAEAQAPRPALAAALPSMIDAPPPLAQAAGRQLARWHRRIVRAALRFETLDDAERHRVRRRVKRLRYATEFVASLYRAKDVARYLARIAPLQESLGRYNDLCVGMETYRAAVGEDQRAWFAIGWLSARRDELLAEAARALDAFAQSEPFWADGRTRAKRRQRKRRQRKRH